MADSILAQVGQWLRRVHDLTADFTPPADECWFIGGNMGPGLIVGHHDAAPYNAVVDGDRLVGFCDWDIAGPSSRDWDLAFSVLSWVPLASPRDGTPLSGNDLQERSRRLHLLLDAYGYDGDRRVFVAVAPHRARRQADVIRRMADAGTRRRWRCYPSRSFSNGPRSTSRPFRTPSGRIDRSPTASGT